MLKIERGNEKMSKVSKAATAIRSQENLSTELKMDQTVTNYMGGSSYVTDALTTMRMVTASSIFGEPSYYEGSKLSSKGSGRSFDDSLYGGRHHDLMKLFRENDCLGIFDIFTSGGDTVSKMEKVIDAALDYDFAGTLDWAVTLRNEYHIRLNPQVIMVRAAMHPKRKEFTSQNPGKFGEINSKVMSRADDAMAQVSYFIYVNGGKAKMPSLLKRSWANHFNKLGAYQVAKYKKADIGMIDAVRICHASSNIIGELMTTGTVEVEDNNKTWENLRSEGKTWSEIVETINMGHMAMLRNIRNVLKEWDKASDLQKVKTYMEKLKSGVRTGKQFPFRYYSAYKAVMEDCDGLKHMQIALDTLEECMDISVDNMPKLKGRTVCLSDNSGSAWGALTSEYGSTLIAEIDNLSSVLTAMCSDEGYVVTFGDKFKVYPISKRRGVLEQTREICNPKGRDVGHSTEGGIWEFLYKITEEKDVFDNIFIYSDQQAGTGGLYGTGEQANKYHKLGYSIQQWASYINVYKMILDYRRQVNGKVNVFSVQTAGYDNMVIPNYTYRTNLMYGWTGRESVFADVIIKEWDRADMLQKHPNG